MCLECDIVETIDFLSDNAALESIATLSLDPDQITLANFALAERRLADGDISGARDLFNSACPAFSNESNNLTAFREFAATGCAKKLAFIDQLERARALPYPDNEVSEASLLLANTDALVSSLSMGSRVPDKDVPLDYYLARSAELRAAKLLDDVLEHTARVAWADCYIANLYPASSPEYEVNYRRALDTYMRLVNDYPASSTTMNALQDIEIIEDKLADPAKRQSVPEDRRTIDKGSFPPTPPAGSP